MYSTTVATPVGPLTAIVGVDGIRAMGFTDVGSLRARLPGAPPVAVRDEPDRVADAMRAWLAGDLEALDALPVAQTGTEFFDTVWASLRAVPAGQTVSYTELAARAGRPTAVRAAASACARNLVAPLVPCHRALRGDGSLGGYYWGLPVKRWLLEHERRYAAITVAG